MDVNDELGFREFLAEAGILRLKAIQLDAQGVDRWPPPLTRCEGGLTALPVLLPPTGQQRRIQPFPAEQGSDLAGLATQGGLFDNPHLVGRAITTAGPPVHFGIGTIKGWGRGDHAVHGYRRQTHSNPFFLRRLQ